MTKFLTASLVALMAMSTALPVVLALTSPTEAAGCRTSHSCDPNGGDPDGGPGGPGNDPGPGDDGPGGGDGPGSPGDPYIPPDFTVADIGKNMLIACRVSGTPEHLPNDLRFRNIGDLTIPAGTRVYWLISETQDHGFFVLPQDLPVGKSVSDLDVLPQGLPTDDHCFSKIM